MKRILSFALCIALLFLVSCSTAGGDKEYKTYSRQIFDYFDTFGVIYDHAGLDEADFNKSADEICEILASYHRYYDIYNEYEGINNIATVNRLAGQGAVKVDAPIIELLEFSREMYTKTNGKCNVAFGAVLKLWHDCRSAADKNPSSARIPSDAELAEAAKHTDIDKLIIDRENMTVELLDPEMRLDVGAVAKGYTAERVADYVKGKGLTSYVIDIGGNLRVVGEKPNGDGWRSGVYDPLTDGYAKIIELRDSSLVTSGSYQRYYVVGGVSYHHIIDTETLRPKNDYVSVTVHTENSGIADALSTAIFNMTLDEARDTVSRFDDTAAVIVKSNGEVVEIGTAK